MDTPVRRRPRFLDPASHQSLTHVSRVALRPHTDNKNVRRPVGRISSPARAVGPFTADQPPSASNLDTRKVVPSITCLPAPRPSRSPAPPTPSPSPTPRSTPSAVSRIRAVVDLTPSRLRALEDEWRARRRSLVARIVDNALVPAPLASGAPRRVALGPSARRVVPTTGGSRSRDPLEDDEDSRPGSPHDLPHRCSSTTVPTPRPRQADRSLPSPPPTPPRSPLPPAQEPPPSRGTHSEPRPGAPRKHGGEAAHGADPRAGKQWTAPPEPREADGVRDRARPPACNPAHHAEDVAVRERTGTAMRVPETVRAKLYTPHGRITVSAPPPTSSVASLVWTSRHETGHTISLSFSTPACRARIRLDALAAVVDTQTTVRTGAADDKAAPLSLRTRRTVVLPAGDALAHLARRARAERWSAGECEAVRRLRATQAEWGRFAV